MAICFASSTLTLDSPRSANADLVINAGYEYVFGLKGNQIELHQEAKELLLPLTDSRPPEIETAWEHRNGKRIRRRLWRTEEMAGFQNSVGTWNHLRQTWLVRQETLDSKGLLDCEDRFFLTSLGWAELKPQQILLLVRYHWAIENDCFNSLDLQWREDAGPWCTQGTAIWGLSVLRVMAYNTAQILRRRRLRKKDPDGTRAPLMTWRSLFKAIEKSFELDAEALCTG